MMLPLPAAVALERAIEAVLRLDPDMRAKLAALDGKLVRFEVAAPDVDVVLGFVDGRVTVPSAHDAEVDATVAGTLRSLLSLSASNDALLKGEVRMSGDISVGVVLRDAVKGLDVDWQERLSPLLGDSVVHRLDRAAGSLRGWVSRSRGAMRENARDWFQDEAELVATHDEVEGFAREVDVLREAADRLAARLALLERRASASRGEVDGAAGASKGEAGGETDVPGTGGS